MCDISVTCLTLYGVLPRVPARAFAPALANTRKRTRLHNRATVSNCAALVQVDPHAHARLSCTLHPVVRTPSCTCTTAPHRTAVPHCATVSHCLIVPHYCTAPHRTREIYLPLRAGGLRVTPRLAA
eukprot:6707517-Pyramimonas_sp.AAC.2